MTMTPEIRRCLHQAVYRVGDDDDGIALADEIIDMVADVIRERFGLSFSEADLLLRDVRLDATGVISNAGRNLVDVDEAVNAVVDYLEDEDQPISVGRRKRRSGTSRAGQKESE